MKRSDVKLALTDSVLLRSADAQHVDAVIVEVTDRDCRAVPYNHAGGGVWFVARNGARIGPRGMTVVKWNGEFIQEDEPAEIPALVSLRARLLVGYNMACAMQEFCRRVDAGEIRSVKTYATFKALLAEYDAL